jgi:predicted metalloprotease with PDZ domain
MFRRLVLLLLAPLLCAAAPARPPVAYTLSPELVAGKLTALKVTVRFHADPSGKTEFAWEPSWAGDRELWRWARDLSVEGAQSVVDEGLGRRAIRATPGAMLTVRYRIVSAYDHDPTVADLSQSKPAIRPSWFYAVGEALFGRPEGHDDDPVTFAWEGAPAGFGFASDLQHLDEPDHAGVRPGTVSDMLESIAIGGGDLQVFGSLNGGSRVRVAILGHYDFAPAELDALARRVIPVERGFWGEDDRAPFLVTAAPLQSLASGSSLSGTGRNDAFALWLDQGVPLAQLSWLLAHEYFHTWNSLRLGGASEDEGHEPEAYWFSEGFTDYYARALMVRSGLITPEEFAGLWNEMLLAYAASPERRAPNARVAEAFWSSEVVEKLPYQRGAMLAAIWNARLRARSRGRIGLDDVMRTQRAAAAKGRSDAAALFPKIARRFGLDVSEDLKRFVDQGEPLTLPQDVFGPCARVMQEERPVFSRGFDSEATAKAGMRVVGTDPASPAYAAGLRDGMTVVARVEGRPGDSLKPYALQVDDHGARRVIRYLPQGATKVRVQQVRLTAGAGATCAATLGGLGG